MIKLNDIIKLNEELCPNYQKTQATDQFGSLNYFVEMLKWEFKVVRDFIDNYHGDMVECEVINIDLPENPLVVLRRKDCVLHFKTSTHIKFEILKQERINQSKITSLESLEQFLLNERKLKKAKKIPISDESMIENWKKIKQNRKQLREELDKQIYNFIVKHKSIIYEINDTTLDTLSSSVHREIRRMRQSVKTLTKSTHVIDGFPYYKIGGILVEPNQFGLISNKLAKTIIQKTKVPTTTEKNFVGIEIEMLSGIDFNEIEKLFCENKLHRYVNLGEDVSIKCEVGGFYAMELRICVPEDILDEKLKAITNALKKARCYVNKTCGMHVHLDMRNRDPELCYRNLFKVQDIMLSSQPLDRRKNKYCQPNTTPSLKLSEFDGDGDNATRRLAINTQSYNKNNMKTIEIRIHEGSVKYENIFNWVNFLVGTVSLTEELRKPIQTITELKEANFLSDQIIDHLNKRIVEYSA